MHSSRSIRWAVALCLLLITATGCFWFLAREGKREVESTLHRLVEQVRQALHFTPEVTINQTVYLRQHAPLLELVTAKREFRHQMQWRSKRLGSTKEIALEGEFTARTGFDLKEPFSIDVDSHTQTIRVAHPRPRVLSVQTETLRATEAEGWWNGITDADRSEVLSAFTADARTALEGDTTILEATRAELHRQLEDLLGKSGYKVEFLETAPTPAPLK